MSAKLLISVTKTAHLLQEFIAFFEGSFKFLVHVECDIAKSLGDTERLAM